MKTILHEEHSERSTALSKVLETLDELLAHHCSLLFFPACLSVWFAPHLLQICPIKDLLSPCLDHHYS